MQRCFWVGTTSDPVATAATDLPDNLWPLGFAHLAGAFVVLGVALLVWGLLWAYLVRLERRVRDLEKR